MENPDHPDLAPLLAELQSEHQRIHAEILALLKAVSDDLDKRSAALDELRATLPFPASFEKPHHIPGKEMLDHGVQDMPVSPPPHSADMQTPPSSGLGCSQPPAQAPTCQKTKPLSCEHASTRRRLKWWLRAIYLAAQLSLYLLTLRAVFGTDLLTNESRSILDLPLWLLIWLPLCALLFFARVFVEVWIERELDLDHS